MYLWSTFVAANIFCELFHIAIAEERVTECYEYVSCSNEHIVSKDIDCSGTESCTSSTINGTNIICSGDSSCIDSTLDAGNYITCAGYNSCSDSVTSTSTISCQAENGCDHSNVKFFDNSAVLWECSGVHSCVNVVTTPDSSISDLTTLNTRTIYLLLYGAFSGYNTTITSNGNNIVIISLGYYESYGLTINCNVSDSCELQCVGSSCVGAKLNCAPGENKKCFKTCDDDTCNVYDDNNITTYDAMAIVIDNILNTFDENYYLLPGKDSINLEQNCKDSNYLFTSGYNYNNTDNPIHVNLNNNNDNNINNVCCLASAVCANGTIIGDINSVDSSQLNIYCTTQTACEATNITNVTNVMSLGFNSSMFSSINNVNGMVVCSGSFSCLGMSLINAKLVYCATYGSCAATRIKNVETIIATGFLAMDAAIIINPINIILVGYGAGYNISIINATDDLKIYCQNSGCIGIQNAFSFGEESNTNTKTIVIYCEPATVVDIQLQIGTDLDHFIGDNMTDLQVCTFNSLSPTSAPTNVISTQVPQLYQDVEKLVSLLNKLAIIVAIGVGSLGLLLFGLSIFSRKKNHKSTMGTYQVRSTHTLNDPASILNVDAITNGNGNGNGDAGSVSSIDSYEYRFGDKSSYPILSYVSGFGKDASHFVIIQLAFELYDIFIDVSYMIELFSNKYYNLFTMFLSSFGLTLLVNGTFVAVFFLKSFQHKRFELWFFEHSGIIIVLTFMCVLTDMGIFVTLFTSQIFGNSIFYSPIGMKSVKAMKTATIISLLVEHIPQLSIQCYLIFVKSKQFTNIMIASLIVSIVDTLYILFKGCIWLIAFKKTKVYYSSAQEME